MVFPILNGSLSINNLFSKNDLPPRYFPMIETIPFYLKFYLILDFRQVILKTFQN